MSRLSPWAGWAGGLLGWVLSDQAGSDLAQWNCTNAAPPLMLVPAGTVLSRRWRAALVLPAGGYALVVAGLLMIPRSALGLNGPVRVSFQHICRK